ncbi:MAG: ATP-binding protein [Bacteroidales bacterium]
MGKDKTTDPTDHLVLENEALRLRLAEAFEALNAVRLSEAYALVEAGMDGNGTFSLTSAGSPYRAFLEQMDEVVLTLTGEGIIIYCNHRFAQLLGYTVEQLTGLPFHRFIAPGNKEKSVDLLYSEMLAKRNVDIEFITNNYDLPITLRLTVKPVPGANPDQKLFIVGSDISEFKHIEGELRQTQYEWETRMAERTSKLARANEELVASRIATLSIMEDAVEAKNSLEVTNKKLLEEIAERINTEKKLEEANEQLRALTARVVAVREEERTSLSREIHDELGSSLTGLKMDLMLIKRNIHENPDNQTITYIMENITSMARLIDSTIVKIRQIVTELRPEILDELGLLEAIRWYAGDFQKRTEVFIQLTIFPKDFTIGKMQTTELFRIFQEVLTNISRHSRASKVMVFLKKENHQCTLRIKDNGIGIKDEDIARKNSFGLLGMRERTSLMNGKLKIVGKAGEGTTITIEVPLADSEL